MSSTKPFEVKNTKTICIRESELYKAIKSLSLFFIIWFSKKVQKTKKITKNKKQQQQQKQTKAHHNYSLLPRPTQAARRLYWPKYQPSFVFVYNRAFLVLRIGRYIRIDEVFS